MTKLEMNAIRWLPLDIGDNDGRVALKICLWDETKPRGIIVEDGPGTWREIKENGLRGSIVGNLFAATSAIIAANVDWGIELGRAKRIIETIAGS